MRKKRITGLLLSLLLTTGVWADDSYTLLVNLTGGRQARYALAERPTVRFTAGGLNISTAALSTDYPAAEVVNFTFADADDTGIRQVGGVTALTVRQTADGFSVEGLTAGDRVRVYDASGRLLRTAKSGGETRTAVSLPKAGTSVYLIKINEKQTIKIKK